MSRYVVQQIPGDNGGYTTIAIVDTQRKRPYTPEILFCVSLTIARRVARLLNAEERF